MHAFTSSAIRAVLLVIAPCVAMAGISAGPIARAAESVPKRSVDYTPTRERLQRLITITEPAGATLVRVDNIQLEAGPNIDSAPSVDVTFDLVNDSSSALTDIVLDIALIKSRRSIGDGHRTVLAGPVTIRAKFVLESGFTMKYQMRLRNVQADCMCSAAVDVLSARPVPPS